MKKLIAIAALLLGVPVFALAQSDRELAEALAASGGVGAAVMIIIGLLYLALLVLGIILYIKLWMMSNDVRKLRKYFVDKIGNP
ncbi:MAG: hypothetical protein J6X27_02035 [Bacteroidaceae bacterium]|nr:hypothetical protein [Bacteroidaceae bacterium]